MLRKIHLRVYNTIELSSIVCLALLMNSILALRLKSKNLFQMFLSALHCNLIHYILLPLKLYTTGSQECLDEDIFCIKYSKR